jgi:hypothetical protein
MSAGSPALAAPPASWWTKKHASIVAAVAVAVVSLVAAVVVLWQAVTAPPPMNAPIDKIAVFVASSGYGKLPFGKQAQFMEKLYEQKKELAGAFARGKFNRTVAQTAVNYAWCGGRLREMRLYASAGEGAERDQMLEMLAEKTLDKTQQKKKTAKSATQPAVVVEEPDDGLPKHEQWAEKAIPAKWPDDVQRQWQRFHNDIEARVAELKKEQKAEKKAVGGADEVTPAKAPKKSASGGGSAAKTSSTKSGKNGKSAKSAKGGD